MKVARPHAARTALLLAALCGCVAGPATGTASPGIERRFAALEREYAVYYLGRNPVVATYLGGAALDPALAKIDGRLRDHSAAGIAAEDRRLTELRERFLAFDPGKLPARRRIDRDVALAQIAFLLRQHGVRRYQERALDSYVDEPFRGIDWQLQGMDSLGEGRYGSQADWRRVIERLRAIPPYLATARQQLAAGTKTGNTPDWRMLRGFGLDSAAADRDYFAKTLPAIADARLGGARRDALLAELRRATADAARAYATLRDFVAATFFEDASRDGAAALKPPFRADRFAMGEAEYDWALRNNLRLTKSSAQLFAEATPVVEKTRGEITALAREIAASHAWIVPADDAGAVHAVFAHLRKDAPRSDDEMIRWYQDVGVRLVDYGRRTGLFEIPADYRLEVTVAPPPLRSSIDGAAYYPAPPFKATGIGRFYVAPADNDPATLAQHNRAALADLAAHEGFPGHDWHYKVMTLNRASISLVRWLTPGAVEDSSSMWEDSMAAEGWALYSEALMAEPQPGAPAGFYTPAERLYQLHGKLYRDLRVRIDTGIHTQQMSFDDAVDLYSNVVDYQPGSCRDAQALQDADKRASCSSAWKAVFRYSRWPTQAITYRLGKEQIQELRAEAERRLGADFSARKFHVEFMRQGTIPAGYFAQQVLQELGAAN
jgi:uncharacterized protein (DUF885 family)